MLRPRPDLPHPLQAPRAAATSPVPPAGPALTTASAPGGLSADDLMQAGALGATLATELELAVDLARLVVWRHDLASGRVHFNRQAGSVLGLPERSEGHEVLAIEALIHPDDRGQVLASATALLRGQAPSDFEARYRRSDGCWRVLLNRRAAQRGPDGRVLAFVGVSLDVTERVDSQRQNAVLLQRMDLLSRTAGIGYWNFVPGGERAQWSEELHRLFGVPLGEPVPTTDEWLARHVHPEDAPRVRAAMYAWIFSDRPALDDEFRILRRDGRLRHVRSQALKEGRGADSLRFGLLIDLTDSRQAAQALRSANESVALAARALGLGTWEVDLVDGTALWNEQMWLLRGHPPQPRAMTPEERLACVHPDDRARIDAYNQASLVDPAPTYLEYRVVHPDGRTRWLATRALTVRDEQGRPARRIGVNWDVTDARTAEAVRRERELARRESQAKSRFLARMSHELRTPLNAVLGFAELLLAEPQTPPPLRQRQLAHIHAAGQHLLSLINDVLDLSSLESGELRIERQPVALAALVAGTLPLLAPLQQQRAVRLQLEPLPGTVLGDPTRLRQVLLNLLSNALKYNRPGGEVRLSSRRDGGCWVLCVADTGRGLSAEQLRHLFEPFNRLGLEREDVEGTGIGLAIVKSLVEGMGGHVEVRSQPDRGTVFEVFLAATEAPLAAAGAGSAPEAAAAPASEPAPAPPPAAEPAAAPAPPCTRPGSLLYIEDNPINALIVRELVARRSDVVLHLAVDGHSGVQQAMDLQPDLILLDMQLPDFDGHEVLRRLRAHPATASIPCIALSANAMPEDIERAMQAGLSDYWTKPLDFRSFHGTLDRLFGGTRPG